MTRRLLFTALAALSFWLAPLAAAPSTAETRAFLVQFEGYRLTPYADGERGTVSVGIGHNLSAHGERPKARYTAHEVERFFLSDLARALAAARRSLPQYDSLPADAQLVVISMIWTVGPTGFHRWINLRAAFNYRAYDLAARELRESKWARDVGARRRAHHAKLLLSL